MTGHALPPAGRFGADDGAADPAVFSALVAYAVHDDLHQVQRALLASRVLVPLVATAPDPADGANGVAPGEHGAHLASVTMTGHDGRRALLAFTSLATLAAWDPAARPVPVPTPEAARAAYDDGAAALLLDVAGPVPVTVSGPAMLALAEARPWIPPAEDPDVLAAVTDALAGLPGLAKIDVGACDSEVPADVADLRLTLHVPGADDGDGVAAREVAQVAAQRLASVDLLRLRLERGLDLAVVPG